LALALLCGLGGDAIAAGSADGRWRLRVDLSSFFDGPIGSLEGEVEIVNGRWEGALRRHDMVVALRLAVADSGVRGHAVVKPGNAWGSVSIPFDAAVIDGRVRRELTGHAIMEYGGEAGDRETRTVDVVLSMDRL
jgi:hypothetical protein